MPKPTRFLPLLACALLTSCSSPAVTSPEGPGAARVDTLWWVLLGTASAVFAVLMAFLFWGLFRHREPDEPPRQQNWNAIIIWLGVIMPAVILLATFGFTLSNMIALASPPSPAALTIDVIGHQWWWEARYPAQNVTTANEIHIPAGQPVQVRLESIDVIHSFWVPQLQKKTDVFPGRVTSTWIEASQQGTVRGECAEYCGAQHAHMAFAVVADAPRAFEAWARQEARPAVTPSPGSAEARGLQTFNQAGCIACHTINYGTGNAGGKIGPDLTHLAGRATLAAGTLPNTPGNLGGWILNPQAIKPGSLMPPQAVSSSQMSDLIAYLESLK